jgi:hypothetical protein
LLPYLDETGLAASIDWLDESPDFPGSPPLANDTNLPLLTRGVRMFLCPSDAHGDGGALNYRQSSGWGLVAGGKDPLPSRLLRIGDGLSHTGLFSERLVGNESDSLRRNALLVSGRGPLDIGPACVQAQLPPQDLQASDRYVGATWLRGSDRHARYAHVFPPNSAFRDCLEDGWISVSLMSARSSHSGGINLVFTDAHAPFVSDSIDITIWRAWGSPNGGEPVP